MKSVKFGAGLFQFSKTG